MKIQGPMIDKGQMDKTSRGAADTLLDVIAMLPWWVACALAVVSYLLLHRVASEVVLQALAPGQVGSMVTKSTWRSLATMGQYVLPGVLVVGAMISAYRRRRRGPTGSVANGYAVEALAGISWQEFQILVGEAFRLQGYLVMEVSGVAAEGAVDLRLRKGNETFLVHCKQWKALTVGASVVRELYAAMAAEGAAAGYLVTSGGFTSEARNFARGRDLKLVDGPALLKLIRQAQEARENKAPAPMLREEFSLTYPVTPPCPQCSKPMVQRTDEQGSAPGRYFWGCSDFPACRGTREVG